jgi:hypothetical protein
VTLLGRHAHCDMCRRSAVPCDFVGVTPSRYNLSGQHVKLTLQRYDTGHALQ